MKVRAPEALAGFKALRTEVDALKASLAGLRTGGSTGGSRNATLTRLTAEVAELRAALKASQLDVERLSIAVQQNAAKEVEAVRKVSRAKKTAADEETALVEKNEAYRRKVQLNSAIMTGQAILRANRDVEASITRMIAEQERERERIRAAAARQATAGTGGVAGFRRNLVYNSTVAAWGGFERSRVAVESSLTTLVREQEGAQLRATREAEAARVAAAREAVRARVAIELSLTRLIQEQERERAVAAARAARAARASAGGAGGAGVGRSALRGALAPSGGLFLTYGSSIPALAGGFAAAAAVQQTFSQGSQFQYQMQFVGALGGLASQQIAALSQQVLELGRNSVYGPVELAKGMRVLAQAGLSATDAIKVLPIATKVAQQGETDLTSASETLIGVMNEFKLQISDLPHIGDSLSKVAAQTPTSLGEMASAMKQVTGVSERFNVSLETSEALVGLLAQRKIVGSMAGTVTRRFLEEAYSPRSNLAQQLEKSMGLNPFDAQGNLKKDTQYIQEVISALRSLNREAQQRAISILFDERSAKLAAALVGDVTDEFMKLRTEAQNSDGALQQFSNDLNTSVLQVLKQAWSNLSSDMIRGFDKIKPQVSEFATALRDAFNTDAAKGFFAVLSEGLGAQLAAVTQIMKLLHGAPAFGHTPAINALLPGFGLAGVAAETFYARSQGRGPQYLSGAANAGELARLGAHQGDAIAAQARAASAGYAGQVGALTTGSGTLAAKFMDPDAYKKAQALASANERAATAAQQRAYQRIQQTTAFETQQVEALHRYNLISESEYVRQIDAINERRRQAAIDEANKAVALLQAELKKKLEADKKVYVETALADAKAKRDALLRESKQAQDLVRYRQQGELKTLEDAGAKSLRKHAEDGVLRRQQIQQQHDAALQGQVDAAVAAEALRTRKSFEQDLLQIEQQLYARRADEAKRADPENEKAIAVLLARKKATEAQRDAEAKRNADAVRAAKEDERSFSYGWDSAFKAYSEAATNAAQNARDLFNTAANSMTDAIVNFAMTGKFSFQSFANVVVQEMARIAAARAVAGIVGAIGGSVGGAAAGTAVSGVASTAAIAHTGGIVGALQASRSVSPFVFSGAQRYHTGGIVGSEVPIIAQHGEGVFTPEQMKALSPASSGGAYVSITINSDGSVSSADASSAQLKQLGQRISGLVAQEIVKQQRPGGLLSKA